MARSGRRQPRFVSTGERRVTGPRGPEDRHTLGPRLLHISRRGQLPERPLLPPLLHLFPLRLGHHRRRRRAAPRPPPPPPASAQSPPPPHANLVSGSRRRAPIGRRNAPRHNGAARRRRARQRWGFPLSPQQPSAEKVPARGRRRRARSGAGRTRRGARAPGAGVAQEFFK
ncbi:basic salivary proline-rich protein 1-like [Acinonyx jubatus]|uniref:Basic salivary proline-rich protein 1-like n=1 Tax=Acinonyx jubatus TaxID=32536 RepID=A0ABM3PFA8_ACIJB|nr:basic salivary proline-rich protein 1-like [Acinonyx jubatus]